MLTFIAEAILTYAEIIALANRLFQQRMFLLELRQMKGNNRIATSYGSETLGVIITRFANEIVPWKGFSFTQTFALLYAYLTRLVDTKVQNDHGVATCAIRQGVAIGAGRR